MIRHLFFVLLIAASVWLMVSDRPAEAQTLNDGLTRISPPTTDGGFWLQRSGAAPFLPPTEITCPSNRTVVRIIYNNSGADIWCGASNVSAKSGQERGVKIPHGGSWSPRVLGQGGVWCTWVGGATDAGLAGIPVTCGER